MAGWSICNSTPGADRTLVLRRFVARIHRARLGLAALEVGAQIGGEPGLAVVCCAGWGRCWGLFHGLCCISSHRRIWQGWRGLTNHWHLRIGAGLASGQPCSPHRQASEMVCCCSSVVERILGKAEVGSSILPSSTISHPPLNMAARYGPSGLPRRLPTRSVRRQIGRSCAPAMRRLIRSARPVRRASG